MKVCTKCGKDDVEFSSVWKAYSDGYRWYELSQCVECTRAYAREYQKARRARLMEEYSVNRRLQQAYYARQRKIVR